MTSWWIEVDGLVLPKPLSGHPGLELCNTRSGWGERYHERQEYLKTFAHLVLLAREQGLLAHDRAAALMSSGTPTVSQASTVAEVARARVLRGEARAVLTGTATPAQLRRLARAAEEARGRQHLVTDDRGTRWGWTGRVRPHEPLDALVLAVADLLTTDHPRIAACPGHDCGWLFLDRQGRRRWCQMAVCGNRAKQAAWAARR